MLDDVEGGASPPLPSPCSPPTSTMDTMPVMGREHTPPSCCQRHCRGIAPAWCGCGGYFWSWDTWAIDPAAPEVVAAQARIDAWHEHDLQQERHPVWEPVSVGSVRHMLGEGAGWLAMTAAFAEVKARQYHVAWEGRLRGWRVALPVATLGASWFLFSVYSSFTLCPYTPQEGGGPETWYFDLCTPE